MIDRRVQPLSRDPDTGSGGPDPRGPDSPDGPDPAGGSGPGPEGRIGTTPAGAVIGFTLVGLVLGWLVRPLSVRFSGTAPTVSWLPVLTLLFVAVVVGSVAWSTYRLLHRRKGRLAPHHAVNRLVLAKACALTGALVSGGYFGYALSWLGLTDTVLARERLLHALLAGVAGALLVVGALLLERACRVSEDDR